MKTLLLIPLATSLIISAHGQRSNEDLVREGVKALDNFQFLLKALPQSKWKPIPNVASPDPLTRKNRVRVFEYPDRNGGYLYLVTMRIRAPPADVMGALWNKERVSKWSETTDISKVLQVVGPNTQISYTRTKKQGPIAPRIFVDLNHFEVSAEGTYRMAFRDFQDIDLPQEPESTAVRASNAVSGFEFKASKRNPDVTDLIFLQHNDLKLKIVPSSVLHKLQPSATVKYLENLEEGAKNYGSFREKNSPPSDNPKEIRATP